MASFNDPQKDTIMTTETPKILITASGGKVGQHVAKQLSDKGVARASDSTAKTRRPRLNRAASRRSPRL